MKFHIRKPSCHYNILTVFLQSAIRRIRNIIYNPVFQNSLWGFIGYSFFDSYDMSSRLIPAYFSSFDKSSFLLSTCIIASSFTKHPFTFDKKVTKHNIGYINFSHFMVQFHHKLYI